MAKRKVMEPLSKEERVFAEQNHNIIYDYLHKNNLSIEEFYDIAAIGYVTAVTDYHRREKLQRYAFTTIAWRAMKSSIHNYFGYQKRREGIRCVSLDALTTDSGKTLESLLAVEEEGTALRMYLLDMVHILSPQQFVLFKALFYSSTDRECRESLHMSETTFFIRKRKLKEVLTAYLNESCTGATSRSKVNGQDEERAAPTKDNGSIKQIH